MPSNELSIISLLLNASIVVQLVMLSLFIASIWSWSIIFTKLKTFKATKQDFSDFKERFFTTEDLSKLYRKLQARNLTGIDLIFAAGFKEFARLTEKQHSSKTILSGAERAMRVIASREAEKLEHGLPFLATIGSTSPYVGLFGTVWGIMNSFHALSLANNATIAMVAPGISEALIATAMGLFAAIPGVIFYNRFATETENLLNKYDNFQEEFIAVLQRQ